MSDIDRENNPVQTPLDLSDVFDEIKVLEEKAPGVYFIGAHDGSDRLMCDEYYVVDHSSCAITEEAKKYGKDIQGHPSLLLFPFAEEKSGYKIIEYEIARYTLSTGQTLDAGADLHSLAFYNMEYHPEYFGAYPAPIVTPLGFNTRYQVIDNGIFFIETDLCRKLLAVCYPVWECELSDYSKQRGLQTDFDMEHGINNTLGYLFFEEEMHCLVVFELLLLRESWIESGIIKRPALMNAIWKYHPDYAASHNLDEQKGLHDCLGLLLNAFGENIELAGSVENMISITPEAGYDFLNL